MELEFWWMFIPALVLLSVAVAASVMLAVLGKKKKGGLPVANTDRLRGNPAYARSLRRRVISLTVLGVILLLSLSSAVLTSSRPVTRTIENPVKYTRDIVMCLDVSGSMIETDISVIQTFKELIKNFKGERVSMVVFNSISSQVFPLTDDYEYVNTQLDYVLKGFFTDPADPGYDIVKYTVNDKGASLIGDGLTACSMSFEFDDPDRSRSIILATDNVPNGVSTVSLSDAVGLAKNKGVKVYSINPGSIEYETQQPLPAQEDELRAVSTDTGGIYFQLDDTGTVTEIVKAIGKDQTSEVKADPIITKNDDPNILIWIMIALTIPGVFVYRRLTA